VAYSEPTKVFSKQSPETAMLSAPPPTSPYPATPVIEGAIALAVDFSICADMPSGPFAFISNI